jgi:uroporphyrinogen III methyltransferase/synthase
LLRALVARDALPDQLRDRGAVVDVVPVYETRAAAAERRDELVALIEEERIDVALFTSSSTVQSVVELLGPRAATLLGRITVASIGPVTTETASRLGVRVDVTASEFTVEGLLDALERRG